jgi:hypothetical protein
MAFFIAVHPVNAATVTELIVSIPDQAVALVDDGKLIAHYLVSTSEFGHGDSAESYRTPIGTLFVSGKFGDHLPAGTVIKNRMPTGEVIAYRDHPGRCSICSGGDKEFAGKSKCSPIASEESKSKR